MKIQASEIKKYPSIAGHRAHGKTFLIKRKLFTDNISDGIDLTYWIYVKKYFLWWSYLSSICQGTFRVSKNTITEAKGFIDKEYPSLPLVKVYGC